LFINHAGRLWATTFDGLDRFDPANSHFTVYKLNPQSTAQIDLTVMEDPRERYGLARIPRACNASIQPSSVSQPATSTMPMTRRV
jgi:hypothetical protein